MTDVQNFTRKEAHQKIASIGRAKAAQSGNPDIGNWRYQRYAETRRWMATMPNTDYILTNCVEDKKRKENLFSWS